jgi:hypothetical protein
MMINEYLALGLAFLGLLLLVVGLIVFKPGVIDGTYKKRALLIGLPIVIILAFLRAFNWLAWLHWSHWLH